MRLEIPEEFRPTATHTYPSYCTEMMIEQYMDANYLGDHERIYLPVFWTNYYVKNNYGNGNIKPLYDWLGTLDKTKKYWTVVQYDDGILEMPDGLDIVVFSAGSARGVPIPLIPSHYLEAYDHLQKAYDLTFIGNVANHPLRKQLVEETGCWKMDGFLPQDYYRALSQSEFTLCPRGYGVASFRLYEALHCGAVPIYVSDVHWLPASRTIEWDKIAILVKPEEIGDIRSMMKSHVQDWEYYDSIKGLFTMSGTFQFISGFLKGQEEIEKNKIKCLV